MALKVHTSESGDCQFAKFPCGHKCGLSFQRRERKQHQDQDCLKRPSTCAHCREYTSTWEDVTISHVDSCPLVAVSCPNDCGQLVNRKDVSSHITSECPEESINCKYSFAKCQWKGCRKDLDSHLSADWKEHIVLITDHNTQEVHNLWQIITHQAQKLKEQEQHAAWLAEQINDQHMVTGSLIARLENMETRAETGDMSSPSLCTSSSLAGIPETTSRTMRVVISGFNTRRASNSVVRSTSFYFGNPGYRMRMRVCPNGIESGAGTHISVYIHLRYGSRDSEIAWPFRGRLTIRLHNPLQASSHFDKVLEFGEDTPTACCLRPSIDKDNEGVGFERYISHSLIGTYIKDDKLVFEIPEVIMSSKKA